MAEASGSNRFQGFDVLLTTNGFDPLGLGWLGLRFVCGVANQEGNVAVLDSLGLPLFLNAPSLNPLRRKPFEHFGVICPPACEEDFLIFFCPGLNKLPLA